jgi:hypothetical protein
MKSSDTLRDWAGAVPPTVYLDSGAVVHAPCRRAFRDAATTSMAIIRPTSQAVQLRAREQRAAVALLRTEPARPGP